MLVENTRKQIKEASKMLTDSSKKLGGVIYPKIGEIFEKELSEEIKSIISDVIDAIKILAGVLYQTNGDIESKIAILELLPELLQARERAVNWQNYLPMNETITSRLGTIDTIEDAYFEKLLQLLLEKITQQAL